MLAGTGDAAAAGWRAEGGSTEQWTLRAASVVGVLHRLSGRGSEDSYAWAACEGRLAVAVADGVGSEPGSGEAAARAARAAARAAAQGPTGVGDGDGLRAVLAALQEANRAAEGGGLSTVVVALVHDRGRVAAGRVGDSSAFLVAADGSWVELFPPPDAERDALVTHALPALEPVSETVTALIDPGAVLVLATDGVADPWRDGPATVAPELSSAVLREPSPLELLRLADFSRQGCHDDRTLVAVWARRAGTALPGRPGAQSEAAVLPGVGESIDPGAV